MKWGTFKHLGRIHVAPVDDDTGALDPTHLLADYCPCCPQPDEEEPGMLIHNEPGDDVPVVLH
jgi:hypothetical protein